MIGERERGCFRSVSTKKIPHSNEETAAQREGSGRQRGGMTRAERRMKRKKGKREKRRETKESEKKMVCERGID